MNQIMCFPLSGMTFKVSYKIKMLKYFTIPVFNGLIHCNGVIWGERLNLNGTALKTTWTGRAALVSRVFDVDRQQVKECLGRWRRITPQRSWLCAVVIHCIIIVMMLSRTCCFGSYQQSRKCKTGLAYHQSLQWREAVVEKILRSITKVKVAIPHYNSTEGRMFSSSFYH